MKFLTLFLSLLFSQLFYGSEYPLEKKFFCSSSLGKIPIRQNGRVKPLYVHAKETLRYLTGKTSFKGLSPAETYCLLTLKAIYGRGDVDLKIRVDHIKAQKFFNLPQGTKTLSFDQLLDLPQGSEQERRQGQGEDQEQRNRQGDTQKETQRNIQKETQRNIQRNIQREVQKEIQSHNGPNSYTKALVKISNQLRLYTSIVTGQDWLFPIITGKHIDWTPLTSLLRGKKIKKESMSSFMAKEISRFDQLEKESSYHLEYLYAKANLPTVAMVITLLSLMALTLFKNFTLSLLLCSLTLLTQLTLITLRVLISGRAPITNMYETVMFSGFGALLFSMIIGHFKKEKAFIYVGLIFNMCTLMMMNFATGMLSESISPLVPVLRDNFWLSTHVSTIILSYGALALSWILANTLLIKGLFSSFTKDDQTYYSELIYTILKYGTVLLGAGIILGGVWADYSWGRFWGWDPKETWSLIAFIIYMAILHGRYTNWIPNKRFIPLVAAAFMSIMMAWFGVNYILATGLHSYGFSEGGAIFLFSFFLGQGLLIALSLIKQRQK